MLLLSALFALVFSRMSYIVQISSEVEMSSLNSFVIEEYAHIESEFEIGDLKGYVMSYNNFPYHLYKNSFVELIEEDQIVRVNHLDYDYIFEDFVEFIEEPRATPQKSYYLQQNAIWNLDRVDERGNYLNGNYFYPSTGGDNVDVYIVDTGIDIRHSQFEGRAVWGINTADSVQTDCNGHGTHVAGTVGSKTYGIAKNVNLIAVKVLNCKGSGSYSGILAGLEYVAKSHASKKNAVSVINMSLGGGKSDAINKAVAQLTKQNIHVVVAAGNSNADACNSSPASEVSAMTVGATTKANSIAGFSNWGTCVNILSPGTEIVSTVPNEGVSILQGTSMASPLVAGVYALILSENPGFSPEVMKKLLTTRCSKGYISGLRNNTVNCFVYSLN